MVIRQSVGYPCLPSIPSVKSVNPVNFHSAKLRSVRLRQITILLAYADQKAQIEMVQRRAARFVTSRYRNTSSVTDMLDYLGWESHETRRSKLRLIVFYKIVHGLVDST